MNSLNAPGPQCQISLYRRDERLFVLMGGSLVMQNSDKVRGAIHPHLNGSIPAVDIYIGQLGFIDSSGLGMLVGFQMSARKNKVEMRILGPTPAHMHLFEATRLNSVFRILDSAASEPILAEMARPEYELN
ncbi:MAG: STAS domain-containing protein [Candidatus Sumerlaeia bacterium]